MFVDWSICKWPQCCNTYILHCTLFQITKDSIMIYKGTESDIDSYSSFYDNRRIRETKLRSELKKRGVTDIYICGIATDICVGKYSKLDGNWLGVKF